MFNSPRRIYTVLLPAMVVAFLLSFVGNHRTPSSGGLRYWIGASAFVSFGILLLTTVLFTIPLAVRTLSRRRTSELG